MTENDWNQFTRAITVLAESLGGELSAPRVQAYFRALDDLSIEQVERGMSLCLKFCRFFPKPVEIREAVQGTPDDASARAWEQLQTAFRKAGGWESVVFTDGAVAAALEIAFETWPLCAQTLHELTPEMTRAKQKEFEGAYRRAVADGKRDPRYLRGTCEMTNINSVAKWETGIPTGKPDGSRFFSQRVWIQAPEGGHAVHAEFDFFTGSLVTPMVELLGRPAIRGIAPAPESRLLSAAAGEMVDPAEGKAMLQEIVGDLVSSMRMPEMREPLSAEQVEARRQLLKQQAQAIGE